MSSVVFGLFKNIIIMLKYPFYFVLGVVTLFFVLCCIFIVKGLIEGKRFKKGEHVRVKKHNFFRKIFWDLPQQFVNDLFDKDPEFFKYQGCVIFER